MRGFNKVILMGNLTRDPDLRYTVTRRAYARFGIAVNFSYKDPNGEIQQGVDYINIVAWGPLAETCGRYLRKGSGVFVEGKLKTSSYEARDGSGKRYSTEVVADGIQFVGGRQDNGGNGGYGGFDDGFQQSGYQSRGYQPGGQRNQPPLPPAPPAPPGYGAGPGFSDANFGQNIQDKGFGSDFPVDFSNMAENPDEFRAKALADDQSQNGLGDGEVDETEIPF